MAVNDPHHFLPSIRKLFRYYEKLGARAMEQLSEAELHFRPDPEANNIATIVNHLHGNMRSRWTDFLTSDGEKTWRQRDAEFEDRLETKEAILSAWQDGWACVFDAVDHLQPEDLARTVYIRNEGHTVVEAVHRQLAHYSYHVGQLVFLAKHIRGAAWQSLSIPKGASAAYNEKKFARGKGKRHFTDEE